MEIWIHLEGRNRENLLLMLEYLAKQDSVKVKMKMKMMLEYLVKVSVEVEKVGRNFEDFIPLADVVFVSKVKFWKSRLLLSIIRTWLNGMDVLICSRQSQSLDQNFDKALLWSLFYF